MESKGNRENEFRLSNAGEESFYQDWWRFQYCNRHFIKLLRDDQDLLNEFDKAVLSIENAYLKWRPKAHFALGLVGEYLVDFHNFVNCLIYEHHRKVYSGTETDFVYGQLSRKYNFPFEKLDESERASLKVLHHWTHYYGFQIIPLSLEPDPSLLWEAFVYMNPKDFFSEGRLHMYLFPKKGDWPKGIKISTAKNKQTFETGWDLAVFFHEKDAMNKLESEIEEKWHKAGRQTIGAEKGYSVALFIDRSISDRNKVVAFLKDQVFWFKQGKTGAFMFLNEGFSPPKKNSRKSENKAFREDKKLTDVVSNSYGLNNERRPLQRNNFRRAIALFHWDLLHQLGREKDKREPLMAQTLNALRDLSIASLNHYSGNYKKKLLKGEKAPEQEQGDLAPANNTVITEMQKDYRLTRFCIEQADYRTAQQYIDFVDEEKE
ncbi:MAG: hypothetical protein HLX50_13530 [Alteromonadaceae bacterium]|nr:hypothetical protein [Alteromonadaceae bacterium]